MPNNMPQFRRAQRRQRAIKRVAGAFAAQRVAKVAAPGLAKNVTRRALAAGALFNINKGVRRLTANAKPGSMRAGIHRVSNAAHYATLRGMVKVRRTVRGMKAQGMAKAMTIPKVGSAITQAKAKWGGLGKGQKTMAKVAAGVGGYLAYRKAKKFAKRVRLQRAANQIAQRKNMRTRSMLRRPRNSLKMAQGILGTAAAGFGAYKTMQRLRTKAGPKKPKQPKKVI